MKPLSFYNYFINNKRKVIPIIISITIGVFLQYFLNFIFDSAIEGMYATWLKPMEHISIISSNDGQKIHENIIEELEKRADINKLIPANIEDMEFKNMIGGKSPSLVIRTSNIEVKNIMRVMDLKLKSGRMPESSNEIVLDFRQAAYKGLHVGDYVGDEVNEEETLKGKLKLVGTIEGESVISFISDNEINKNSNSGYVIIPTKGKLKNVNEQMEKYSENLNIYSLKFVKEFLNGIIKPMNIILYSIEILVIIILCITIGNTTYLHYLQRNEEFGLLSAVGFTKKEIMGRIFKEVFYLNTFGSVLGILSGVLLAIILKIVLMDPNGQIYSIFSMKYVIPTLFIPLLVVIFSSVPSMKMISKADKIDIIEGN